VDVNLLYTTTPGFESEEASSMMLQWREAHHLVELMPWYELTKYLQFAASSSLAQVDAIVCSANGMEFTFGPKFEVEMNYPFETALYLAERVRELPDTCTMRDGRKWRSIPFVIFHGPINPVVLEQARENTHAHLCFGFRHPYAARIMMFYIRAAVDQHHAELLRDYQHCGILVRFEGGRAQVKPALRRRRGRTHTEHYNAAGDRRRQSDWVTFSRDQEGLSNDVALFEELLSKRATETEMHKFFSQHPAILMEARGGIPLSHEITFDDPKNQRPDFSFTPILGAEGGNLDLLELKGPAEKLVNRGFHAGFTRKVHAAIDQVRDYERAMRDPANFESLIKRLGFVPETSRLAVLIGRNPDGNIDRKTLELRKGEVDVEIVTYDEIFETQVRQL
jgi:hypothetical protein